MASNINPSNVDGTFPIAGQDNSSQGFRDNFTNIRNNFSFAETEISDLQNKAIVSSPLNGQTFSNDMAGTKITRPQLSSWTQSLIDLGSIGTTTVTLDFNIASFQKFTTTQSHDISLSGWPASIGDGALGFGTMRVWIVVSSATHVITLPSTVDISVNDIAGYNLANNNITFDAAGDYFFDFSSTDGGTTYIISDVSRNYRSFRDSNFYLNRDVKNTLLVGFSEGLTPALNTIEKNQNEISAYGAFNSVMSGVLNTANVAYNQVGRTVGNTFGLSGYTVTALRGNIQQNSFGAVQANDYLGYVNAVTYTGNGSTNTLQQSASVNFFATGGNVTHGMGGNIAFYTATNGGPAATSRLTRALSINDNQVVQVVGTLRTDGGIIEAGTLYSQVTSGTTHSVVLTNAVSTVILDPALGITQVSTVNITLPTIPTNGQRVTISTLLPIVSLALAANVGSSIRFVTATALNVGNTAVTLTYLTAGATPAWYKS